MNVSIDRAHAAIVVAVGTVVAALVAAFGVIVGGLQREAADLRGQLAHAKGERDEARAASHWQALQRARAIERQALPLGLEWTPDGRQLREGGPAGDLVLAVAGDRERSIYTLIRGERTDDELVAVLRAAMRPRPVDPGETIRGGVVLEVDHEIGAMLLEPFPGCAGRVPLEGHERW